jgi:phosphopantothenoylcysteine decarboxylase/phosphopantothenate--cysteine ligase
MSLPAAAERPTVIVGVAGGIAAFKALEVVRRLSETGHDVHVIPTLSALRFVGEASFAALSGNPVHTDVWSDVHNVPHVSLARKAHAIVLVPATADLMARIRMGRADDLLTATVLTATCPIFVCPAMHTEMWDNPATQENVGILRDRGFIVFEPAVGRLTGADSGKGRLPDPLHIADAVAHRLHFPEHSADMTGVHVVVTAGGTREALDPVRYLGNRSSGKQGFAIAQVAAARGASVTLIAANTQLVEPVGVDVVRVSSTADMQRALAEHAPDADLIMMAAAVADFRPAIEHDSKIKKGFHPGSIELMENPDLLSELVHNKTPHQVIVGFAAETGDSSADVIDYGRTKLARKGCDFLVVNDVRGDLAFGSDTNAVTILGKDGSVTTTERVSKVFVAETVCNVGISALSR